MWGRCKIQPRANVSLVVLFLLICILQKILLDILLLPEHQIYWYFFQQWQADILGYPYPLLVCYSVLVDHEEVGKFFGEFEDALLDLLFDEVKDESVFAEIVTDSIVDLGYFGHIELFAVRVIEIFLDFRPTIVNEVYVLAFPNWVDSYSSSSRY